MGAIITIVSACGGSSADAALIRHFQENKATYEQLRNLLIADANLAVVGASGVQTVDSPILVTPPTADISADHYHEYMDLLQKAGGVRVSRSPASDPAVCVGVRAAGWAGDTRHKNFCWHEHNPSHGVFTSRPIESGWYLEGD
jgi:hypothetical protein